MYAALALRLSHSQGGPSEGDVHWRGSVVDSHWNGRRQPPDWRPSAAAFMVCLPERGGEELGQSGMPPSLELHSPRRPPDKRPPLVSDGALAPLRLFLVPLCWQLSVATGHLCLLPPPSSGGSLHPSLAAPSARIQRLAPHPPTLVGHGACPCSRKLNANFSSDSNRQTEFLC